MKIDRIAFNSILVVVAFLCVMLLTSQSGASLVTYALALAMLIRFRAWNDVFHCTLVWPLLAILTYLPLTSLWSLDFGWREFGSQAVRAVLIFCFVSAFAECQLRGDLQRWLFPGFVFTGAAVSVACIVNFYVTDPADGRLNGFGQLDTQVVAALVFGFAALAGLHLLLHGARSYRLPLLLALSPLIVAVGLSGSRTAWVALLLGITATFLLQRRPSTTYLALGIVALAVFGLTAMAISWSLPEIRELIFPRGDSFRLVIWQETLDRIQQRPWFGHGILADDDFVSNGLVFQHAHNLYLSVTFQGGVLGLVLMAWLILRV